MLMCADDTVFYEKGDNAKTTFDLLQLILDIFYPWCNYNNSTVNIDKTKALDFDCKNRSTYSYPKLYIDNKELKYVNTYRYLGILLDRQLKFN